MSGLSLHRHNAKQALSFLRSCSSILALTGAGISASAGIPTYRDEEGQRKGSPPMQHDAFMSMRSEQQRYWKRSFFGWPNVHAAQPTHTHRMLVTPQWSNITGIVTQNVDGLHNKAGSENVIELHGRLREVICMHCSTVLPRTDVQTQLQELNPTLALLNSSSSTSSTNSNNSSSSSNVYLKPDGDVELPQDSATLRDEDVHLPSCPNCAPRGPLKPHVTFFGDSVDRTLVSTISSLVTQSDCLLVLGSSLQVFSGYRYVKLAQQQEIPVVLVNNGRSRGDEDCLFHVKMDCDDFFSLE